MGCLKIGGRVVGAVDGPSREFPACFESQAKRLRLGCDGPPRSARDAASMLPGDDDGALVEELLNFLRTRLSDDDLDVVRRTLSPASDDGMPKNGLASDARLGGARRAREDMRFRARFPNANRLGRGM